MMKLEPGYLVQLRNGKQYLVAEIEDGRLYFTRDDELIFVHHDENLNHVPPHFVYSGKPRPYDVMKVYGLPANRVWAGELWTSTASRKLLWERKPVVKKMTVAEICDALGYEVEIVKEKKHVAEN